MQERILSSVLEKPITALNSSDVNQICSVLGGGIKQMNNTMRSLNQFNEITEYFAQNESVVSTNVDNEDMDVSVIILF